MFFYRLILLGLFSNLWGCSGIPISGKDGSIHHLIIGVGLVTTPGNNGENSVTMTKAQVLGVHFSSQPGLKFAAGYSSSSAVVVPESVDNILLEIEQQPFGALSIKANPQGNGDFDVEVH